MSKQVLCICNTSMHFCVYIINYDMLSSWSAWRHLKKGSQDFRPCTYASKSLPDTTSCFWFFEKRACGKMQVTFKLRPQLDLKMTAMNGWVIIVPRLIFQIWQNEIFDEMGFISPTFFSFRKECWWTPVSPHAHVLTFLSAKCCLNGWLFLNGAVLEGLFHLNVLVF